MPGNLLAGRQGRPALADWCEALVVVLFWVVFPLMVVGGLLIFRNARAVGDCFRWVPPDNRPTFVAKPSLFDRDRFDQEIRTSMARFLGGGCMTIGLGGLLILTVTR